MSVTGAAASCSHCPEEQGKGLLLGKKLRWRSLLNCIRTLGPWLFRAGSGLCKSYPGNSVLGSSRATARKHRDCVR